MTLRRSQYPLYFSYPLVAIPGVWEGALPPGDSRTPGNERGLAFTGRIELVAHARFTDTFPKSSTRRVNIDQRQGPKNLAVPSPWAKSPTRYVDGRLPRNASASAQMPETGTQEAVIVTVDGLRMSGFRPLFTALKES